MAIWSGELHGQRALADFTQPPPNGPDWIPDPETKIIHRGRRKSRHIRNFAQHAVEDTSARIVKAIQSIGMQTAQQKDLFHNANLRRIRQKGYGCLDVICI